MYRWFKKIKRKIIIIITLVPWSKKIIMIIII